MTAKIPWITHLWSHPIICTHTPCNSMGLQTDFFFLLLLPTSIFVFILGTENAVGGHGSLAVYAILFLQYRGVPRSH